MKCPHCSRPVDHEAETCYCCGYSLTTAEAFFGRNYVKMVRLHDAAHCLRKPERDELEEVLDQLENRFPQMLFCAYIGELSPNMRLNELGFWLLNHAQVQGSDYAVRPNENAVLVMLDISSKQAGLMFGYFAESLVPDADAYRCLQKSRPYLVNGEYGLALATLFKKLGRVLSRRSREIRRRPPELQQGIPEDPPQPPPPVTSGIDVPIEERNPIARVTLRRVYN